MMSDYISREELLKDLYSREYTNFQSRDFIALVQYQDKADVRENIHGEWISHREHCEINNLIPSGLGSYIWCSECDCGIDSKYFHRVNHNFCPNCGADMRGE